MNDTENPIGFDETPPETPEDETGAHTVSCYDHVPRTICPPQTNGGRIRTMDNHHLARFLASIDHAPASWTEERYFDWLNELCIGAEPDAPA